jgi:hypothetical protein
LVIRSSAQDVVMPITLGTAKLPGKRTRDEREWSSVTRTPAPRRTAVVERRADERSLPDTACARIPSMV